MNRSKLHLKMPKQTMRRKLFLYTFAMAILLLALLATMLILLGRFRTPKDELFEKSDMQAQVFEREILTHRNTLAMMGVHLSEDASEIIGHYLSEHNMTFAELDSNSGALLELQKLIFEPLRQYLFQTDCSGAFVILDATVNPDSTEVTKSGLYLQVNGYERDRRDAVLYRGIASVSRENGVMPHRKWRLETRCDSFPDWEAATDDTGLSLEQSYRFTRLFTLPGMSERAMLITLPIRDTSGSIIGICGFELSESYFALLHSQVSKLSHPTCLMAEVSENDTYSSFLTCGASDDYYYTPEETLTAQDIGGGLTEFRCGDETFVGVVRSYTGDGTLPGFSAIVMTPKSDFAKATFKNALSIGFLVLLLVVLSVLCCIYVSHRYLTPVLKGLEQIKAESSQRKRTDIMEINNVLDFLSSKERESADHLASLIEDRNTAKEAYDRAQAEIDKLAERTKDTVDPEAYSFFLERIPDLSKTEREIFDYYVSGLSTKEILESANIKESTLKYHNSHIYEKLNVKSRKELLVYISLMNRSKDGGNDCDTGTKTE